VNQRPPRLSPHRLAAGLLLPLASYLLIRALVGSSTTALLIITAIPAIWLLGLWIARRRIDPIGVVTLVTTVIALAAFALTHGDPLALKLRRGVVTGPIGIAALVSVALRRPLLLLLAEQTAKANPDLEARLANPARRRFVTVLTAIVGLFLAIDGLSQIFLAVTVPTGSFVADSTAVRIAVIGAGVIVTAWYIRDQNKQINSPRPRSFPAKREG
jgi:intracellular septation protein A